MSYPFSSLYHLVNTITREDFVVSPKRKSPPPTTASGGKRHLFNHMLSLFSEEIQQRKPKEQDSGNHQNRNADDRRNSRIPELERHAQHLLKLVDRTGRRASKPGLDRVLHNHLPQHQRGVRRREELDDRLHALRQLPDGDIDARQKADDGAHDGARNRKRVVALEKRNEEQHQRGVAKRRKQDQPEDFE